MNKIQKRVSILLNVVINIQGVQVKLHYHHKNILLLII